MWTLSHESKPAHCANGPASTAVTWPAPWDGVSVRRSGVASRYGVSVRRLGTASRNLGRPAPSLGNDRRSGPARCGHSVAASGHTERGKIMKLNKYWRRIAVVFTGLGATVAALATLAGPASAAT